MLHNPDPLFFQTNPPWQAENSPHVPIVARRSELSDGTNVPVRVPPPLLHTTGPIILGYYDVVCLRLTTLRAIRLMSSMEESDAAAVSRTRAGDSDAFRVLVERHSRNIFRLAYRMTGSEQDAEDVVQESFLKAFRQLKGFEERANFGTWLYRI